MTLGTITICATQEKKPYRNRLAQAMGCVILPILLLFALGVSGQTTSKQLFNFDWKFHRGGAIGAENGSYDDSKWRNVELPHDWSIEDLPGKNTAFDSKAVGQVSTGFTEGGVGWYRKEFIMEASDKNKITSLTFEGVYMNAYVYLNGKLLKTHPYGYTEFTVDITNNINYGKRNVLAVKVNNVGENSRWYSGSGIYRNVWLQAKDNTHLKKWSNFIHTKTATENKAQVVIENQILNLDTEKQSIKVVHQITDANNKIVFKDERLHALNASDSLLLKLTASINKPLLWDIDRPNLYTLKTIVYKNDRIVDLQTTKFGIRDIKFSTSGFNLNDRVLKLKGGCIHHDNGILGAKAYKAAEIRKIQLLKDAGYNAIRTAHNPPSTGFLDACDSLGMLVIDEAFDCWADGKNPYDYHLYFEKNWKSDIEAMVLRDRNHPSVILWSTGNEIPFKNQKAVVKSGNEISSYIKFLDPTRLTTSGVHELSAKKDALFATTDIAGYNYAAGGDHNSKDVYQIDHERMPNRIIYESEAYPLEAFDSWMKVLKYDYVIGAFVWTALDYYGEASIGWKGYWPDEKIYPWSTAYCGDFDIVGNKRPASYYRDALWKTNQLSVFVSPPVPTFEHNPNRMDWSKWHWEDVLPDWNWEGYEGKVLNIVTYSSCDEVELFVNNKSQGKKKNSTENKYRLTWPVAYSAGEIEAIGYNKGKKVSTQILKTAKKPALIKLKASKNTLTANKQDLVYVEVDITDLEGNVAPKADNLINFEINGAGEIIAVGNANPLSLESLQEKNIKAFKGKCLVVIKSTKQAGDVTLKATADGLKSSEITIKSSN
ncbi:MAG TPA: glycoside hydrolase family 2 TIM barrel-domain containing protein [Pedobacter sp.]|jgi:beta-galactosidase